MDEGRNPLLQRTPKLKAEEDIRGAGLSLWGRRYRPRAWPWSRLASLESGAVRSARPLAPPVSGEGQDQPMGKAHPTRPANGREEAGPQAGRGTTGAPTCGWVPGARWKRRDDCSEQQRSRRGRQVRGCGGHTGLGAPEAAVRGGLEPTAPGCLLPRGQALPRCLNAG